MAWTLPKLSAPYRILPTEMALWWSLSETHGPSVLPARLYHLAVYEAELVELATIVR